MKKNSLALNLSSLIVHIEYQRNRILEHRITATRMCHCRTLILNSYTDTLHKFLIRLSSRTLKFFDDYDYAVTTGVGDLHQWFFSDIYDTLINEDLVSNKMVVLFRLVQEKLDDKFFDIIDEQYRNIIKLHKINDNTPGEISAALFNDIREWFELFVYSVLAVQIDCNHISDKIYEDFDIRNDSANCGVQDEKCANCPFSPEKEGIRIGEGRLEDRENLKIVMNNEFTNDMSWIKNMMTVLTRYHTCPDEIRVEMDYRMYDKQNQHLYRRDQMELILEMSKFFGNVMITNYDGVDFGMFEENIQPYLRG
jgi:hypothetical protein